MLAAGFVATKSERLIEKLPRTYPFLVLATLMSGTKAPKVIEAFMQMTKFDIATLEKAAE